MHFGQQMIFNTTPSGKAQFSLVGCADVDVSLSRITPPESTKLYLPRKYRTAHSLPYQYHGDSYMMQGNHKTQHLYLGWDFGPVKSKKRMDASALG